MARQSHLDWRELLRSVSLRGDSAAATLVRESLVAVDAPLMGVDPVSHLPLEELLPVALRLAHLDATVLRVLPVVLARHHTSLDWGRLATNAEAAEEAAALGMLLELTGRCLGLGELVERARAFETSRGSEVVHFFSVRNQYDRELTELRTPPVARRWGFLLNMTEESFRSLLEKHGAPLHA